MDNSVLYLLSRPVNLSALTAASTLILIAFILILFRDSFITEKKKGKKKEEPRKKAAAKDVYTELLRENEIAANLFFAKALLAVTVVFVLIAIGAEANMIFVADKTLFELILAGLISATATAALITIRNEGRSEYGKRLLIAAFIIDNFLMCIMFPGNYGLLLLFPIMISIRYGEGRFTAGTTAVCLAANIISRPAAVAFGIYSGNYELQRVSIPEDTKIVFSGSLTETFLKAGFLNGKTVLMQELSLLFISTMLIVFAGLCMTFMARHLKRMIIDGAELTEQKNAAENEIEAARTKIMMSQLQPHFLYNSLSAIMAIDGNPPETIDALADFSRYLRANLDSLTCSDLIPFAAETEHIERYLALEKLRFADRIKIEYDIKVTDFMIPPLSVQMAVENAVKHGITQKPDGGTLKLSTEEKDGEVLVTVEDDGVGFDTSIDFTSSGNHVGLTSGVERVKKLTGGYTDITSKIGEGTKVVIHLPRDRKE